MKKRVVVGMSGGVDSSVAALMLKREGYDVIGVFMKNWDEEDDDGACTAASDYADVQRVCDKIDIPYYTVNFTSEYWERVFQIFLDEYKRGRTPNPDILCNKEIKFAAFLDFAKKLEADYLATGHYAQLLHENEQTKLIKAADRNKDQTYFLASVPDMQFHDVLFPIGHMEKSDLRELALKENLYTANKKDSTGICFIGERKFKEFLQRYLPAQPGEMQTLDGEVVGHHDGLMYHTLGQRKGLGIGGCGNGQPWFVIGKDLEKNVLLVEQGETDHLYSKSLLASSPNWIAYSPKTSFDCYAKFRYRQADQKVHVELDADKVLVTFAQKQRAVTPGQWAVFYDGDTCLGGAVIDSTRPVIES